MFNTMSRSLDAQRIAFEELAEAGEKIEVLEERMETIQDVEIGQTASEVVYEENKLELLHYQPEQAGIDVDEDEREDVPILIVFALVNVPHILDLQHDRSVVRRLLENGHDVYLIDWNEPSRLDQHLTLDDYVNRYIHNCVDDIRDRSDQESINLLGYCMGGTMSTMFSALHPEKVNALGLMAAGLYFEETGGVLEQWADEEYFDPSMITETYGNVPSDFLDEGFEVMDPVTNKVSKWIRFYDNLENEYFVKNFARMEKWLGEGVDIAGATYDQFIEDIYQKNKLYNNELYLNDKHIDIDNIDMPVIQILAEYDHLVPPQASKPFNDVIPSEDTEIIEYSTGHIGLAVSSSTQENVWPQVAEWFSERSQVGEDDEDETVVIGEEESVEELEEAEEEEEPAAEEEEAEEEEEPSVEEEPEEEELSADVETVDGIGPTYAERLHDAGIETVADLSDETIESVAEASEAPDGRVEDWFEQIE